MTPFLAFIALHGKFVARAVFNHYNGILPGDERGES
jgi:hypothetical protein